MAAAPRPQTEPQLPLSDLPQFLPVLKPDLIAALAEEGLTPEQVTDFHTLCTFVGAYFHHDFYDELTDLKDTYAWFAPTGPRPRRRATEEPDASYKRLCATLESVMQRGNFSEMPRDQINELGGDHPLFDVKTRTPLDAYEDIRIFYRGHHTEMVTQPKPLIGKAKEAPVEVFEDVVVFIRFRDDKPEAKKRLAFRNVGKLPGDAVPGSVMIKLFRSIARSELPMLLPEVKVVMTRKDALLLGGPALLGGVPILLNIVPALSVVLVVLGAYLGFSGEITQDKLMKAVGALSALVGAGAFMWRQYSNYSFRKLKYQKKVADNVYFKNVNNNTGVFETLIGAAEAQETKEVILAYHALLTGGPAAHGGELDRRIEAWLKTTYGIEVDFDVADALRKLEGLGFLTQKDGKMAVVPLPDALARLDTLWDRLYDFAGGPRKVAAA